eukprot:3940637-Rhodomonas_salina.2
MSGTDLGYAAQWNRSSPRAPGDCGSRTSVALVHGRSGAYASAVLLIPECRTLRNQWQETTNIVQFVPGMRSLVFEFPGVR